MINELQQSVNDIFQIRNIVSHIDKKPHCIDKILEHVENYGAKLYIFTYRP